jgi:protoheme IX farnesyltransferase
MRRIVADYLELLKLRITAMVVITAWAGFYLGCMRSGISSLHFGLIQVLIGVALTSSGAAALNQSFERAYDARMTRTAKRPMPTGRIGLANGIITGLICVFGGVLYLAFVSNLVTSALALLTVALYIVLYTPLKRVTPIATFVGAFPGALPPVIGWTAARGTIEWPAVALFAIIFVWQFPHFMAIAWLYRRDYAKAGIRMRPVVQPDGYSTVAEALTYAVLMIPVSLVPVYLGISGPYYGAAAVLLGLGYLAYTIRFGRILRTTDDSASLGYARTLLRASVIYLPLLLAAMMLNARGAA